MKDLLLVIDLQLGFKHQESKLILSNILKLINCFNGKIIFTKFYNNKNSLFEKQLNWIKFQNIDDQKLLPELEKFNYSEIRHNGYTVLNKKLKKFLTDNKIKKVYLSGVYTDVCVIKTAMDLFDNNIESFVIKDACASLHGKKNHNLAINSLKHIIGKKHVLLTKNIC